MPQTLEVGEIFKNPRDSHGLVIQRPLVAMETIDRLCGFKILSFAEVMIQQQNLGGWHVVWLWLSILALLHVCAIYMY